MLSNLTSNSESEPDKALQHFNLNLKSNLDEICKNEFASLFKTQTLLDSYRSLIYFKLSLFIRVRIEQSLLISENENFLGDRKHHQHQLQKILNLNSFNYLIYYL